METEMEMEMAMKKAQGGKVDGMDGPASGLVDESEGCGEPPTRPQGRVEDVKGLGKGRGRWRGPI